MVNLFTPSTYRHELRVFYICVTLLLCHCVAYIVRVLSVVETPGCHFYTNRLYKAGVITVSQTNHERAQPVYSRRKDQIFSSFATWSFWEWIGCCLQTFARYEINLTYTNICIQSTSSWRGNPEILVTIILVMGNTNVSNQTTVQNSKICVLPASENRCGFGISHVRRLPIQFHLFLCYNCKNFLRAVVDLVLQTWIKKLYKCPSHWWPKFQSLHRPQSHSV